MRRALVYGNAERKIPWLESFHTRPDGSIDIYLSGVNIFEIEEDQEIRWLDLFNSKIDKLLTPEEIFLATHNFEGDDLRFYEKHISLLWNELKTYCHPKSQAERDFFNLYCQLTINTEFSVQLPALIPNVFINWYLSKERTNDKKEPYIVDFVFKSSVFGTNDLVVVEIDGYTHYSSYNEEIEEYIACEKIYATHLARDRWLRKQGFKVFRIGNFEIKKIMAFPEKERLKEFYYFFNEVFGDVVFIESYYLEKKYGKHTLP